MRFQNILKVGWDAVEYLWWLSLGGCGGVCVVVIIRYRCLLAKHNNHIAMFFLFYSYISDTKLAKLSSILPILV